MKLRFTLSGCRLLLAAMLLTPAAARAAEGDPLPAPAETALTNQTTQAQVTPEALETLRREIELSTARNAQAVTAALQGIEPALARLHQRDLEMMERSTRTVLITAGACAGAGFLGLLVITLILVRSIGRLSETVAMSGSRALALGPGGGAFALGAGDFHPMPGAAAEQAATQFHGALEQLQQRIRDLEQSLQPRRPLHDTPGMVAEVPADRPRMEPPPSPQNIRAFPATDAPAAAPTRPPETGSETAMLMGKGQTLLNLDEAAEALACFDRVLTITPGFADAWVKRGLALEKLNHWEEAVESYNRAVTLEPALTVAYLYKGGVCNRLQRFREALECYEQALRAEKSPRAS